MIIPNGIHGWDYGGKARFFFANRRLLTMNLWELGTAAQTVEFRSMVLLSMRLRHLRGAGMQEQEDHFGRRFSCSGNHFTRSCRPVISNRTSVGRHSKGVGAPSSRSRIPTEALAH
jgi:hypothetical protein